MTYDLSKKLIDAANLLKENCNKNFKGTEECDCPFSIGDHICAIEDICPHGWEVPNLCRWTAEDVALAEALKNVGAKVIYKTLGSVYWATDDVNDVGKLPNESFKSIKDCESFSIEYIIKEAEG